MSKLSKNEGLIIATHNEGKLAEISALLAPLSIKTISAAALDIADIEETGDSFAENAALKAHHCARAGNKPALSDDSGLCVDALGGAPGIYSARWAGEERDFSLAIERLWQAVCERKAQADKPIELTAHFTCVLCLAFPDGGEQFFEGRVNGTLAYPPKGEKGFGYDPIFIPNERVLTFGEMSPKEKHALSHRADAFKKFIAFYEHD